MVLKFIPELCGIPFRGVQWRIEWLEPGLSRVYTVNAEFLYWAVKMPRFLEALQRGDNSADGKWIVWLLNLKYGEPIAEHLPGSRIIRRVLDEVARKGLRLAIVGSTSETLARAALRIRRGWRINVLTYAPGLISQDPADSPDEVREIEKFILQEQPDVVLVSLGPPKQEILIDMISPTMERAGVRLAMGVGGAVGMLAGEERLAPAIISRLGLEWMWRLAQNPGKRWRKVIRSLRGLACGFREAMAYRSRFNYSETQSLAVFEGDK